MTVVQMEKQHLHAVAEIEKAVFPDPWSEQSLALFCEGRGVGMVATDEAGDVLAYACMVTIFDEGEIPLVATHPAHRRQGYADRVLRALLDEARARGLLKLSLEVRESNAPAIALYSRLGFEVVGKRNNFYTAPHEHALVMVCNLS